MPPNCLASSLLVCICAYVSVIPIEQCKNHPTDQQEVIDEKGEKLEDEQEQRGCSVNVSLEGPLNPLYTRHRRATKFLLPGSWVCSSQARKFL